ncbi:signal peptidase II [Telmatobacter bradus]|uniref:signal peptidase II n=1 Tax=Telmatobacter bradus TaxID=474953 RepID=UPI003B42EB2A
MSFPRTLAGLFSASALVVLADRWTKVWVSRHIELGGAIPVLPSVLRITHWTNEGAAFSMFADSASPHAVRWGLVAFSAIAALIVAGLLVRMGRSLSCTSAGLALILGGAVGNLYDRVAYGSVVDFIEVHILTYHWPDFNVADSAIVTGACLLMLEALLPQKNADAAQSSE